MSKVFIGNLPDKARGVDVEDFFAKFGRLREISLKNGYGFVEFDDPRDAEDAVRDLNGERLAGERVTIEMARGGNRGGGGRRSRSRDRYGGGGRSSHWDNDRRDRRGKDRPHRTAYAVSVDNLSSRCSWAELKDIMRKCGEVTYTDAHYRSGEGRGEVCYSTREDMERCLDEMDGFEINGKKIRVSQGEGESRGRSRSRSRSAPRGGRNRARPHRTPYCIAIDNLSSRCDWAELKDYMRKAGEVTYVDAHNRMGRGRGEACYSTRDDLYRALDSLQGTDINGKCIKLSIKEDGDKDVGRSQSRSRSRSRSRSNSRSRSRSGRRSRSRSNSRSRSRSR